MIPEVLYEISRAIEARGGIPYLVGGYVRDKFMNRKSKDFDVEVFQLSLEDLTNVLGEYGTVSLDGSSKGVLRIAGHSHFEFSIPRRDGPGRKPEVQLDPNMDIAEAAMRRDFTMNAIYLRISDGFVTDPYNGVRDAVDRKLHVIDERFFVKDPLRTFRAAQFLARFNMEPVDDLLLTCKEALEHEPIAMERILVELDKLLTADKPSVGLEFLLHTRALEKYLPELHDLKKTGQDPDWHPEGDVFIHTCMVVDEAAIEQHELPERYRYVHMWAALLHDIGKAPTTKPNPKHGRLSAKGHADFSERMAKDLLARLGMNKSLIKQIAGLCREHMRPCEWCKPNASAGRPAYRRLLRRLEKDSVDPIQLWRLSRADMRGRGGPASHDMADQFYSRLQDVENEPAAKLKIQGRDLIARGVKPGPEMGRLIRACTQAIDQKGFQTVDEAITYVFNIEGREG